jgi:hypothetical protein
MAPCSPKLSAKQPAFLFVFGPVDFAAGEALIENVKRRGASFAAGRQISHPDNNGGDPY